MNSGWAAKLEAKFFTLSIVAGLLVAGSILGWLQIPLEVAPAENTPSFLYIQAQAREEQTPVQLEALATQAIEGSMRTVGGVLEFSTRTGPKAISVSMQLKPGTDLDLASVQAMEALQPLIDARVLDPKGISISRFNPDAAPIIRLGLTDPSGLLDLPHLVRDHLVPRVESIPQISKAELLGSEPGTLTLNLGLAALLGRGVDPVQLGGKLRPAQWRESIGQVRLQDGRTALSVRGQLLVEDLATYRSQMLTRGQGLRLADLGELKPEERKDKSASRVDGRDAIFLEIYLRDRASPFEMEKALRVALSEFQRDPRTRGTVHIEWIMNRVDDLSVALGDVKSSLLQSILITFAVIYFFIRKWGRTAVISSTIPLTLVLTVGLLRLAGMTLNIMTLSGLILGIGMVVDNVILVVDRTLELTEEGVPLGRAVLQAVGLSAPALIMATVTNAVIFLPVAFSESEDGFVVLLKAFQAPILATLLASLVLAVFILPVMVRSFPRTMAVAEKVDQGTATERWFVRLYEKRRLAALACLLGMVFLAERVSEIPQTDLEPPADPWVSLNLNFLPEFPKDSRRAVYEALDQKLLKAQSSLRFRSVASTFQAQGDLAGIQLYPEAADEPEVELKELEARVRTWLAQEWTPIPGTGLGVAYEAMTYSSGNGPRKVFEFQGPSSAVLDEILSGLRTRLAAIDGVTRVLSEEEAFGEKEWVLVPNEMVLARAKLNSVELAQKISASMQSVQVGPLRWNGGEVGIRIALLPGQALPGQVWDRNTVMSIPVSLGSGKSVTVGALGWLVEKAKRRSISREKGLSKARVAVEFRLGLNTAPTRKALGEAQSLVSQQPFPPGYGIKTTGTEERLEAMQKNMIFMIVLASALIYLLLGAAFESLLLPLAVLATIPAAILSGIFGLWLMGRELDVMARLSLVVLVGIGVNNAIILIDLIQELRSQGLSKRDAVIQGCSRRLQAVLMTTSIQVLGVIPVAVGNSKIMGIPYASLGVCIISGMLLGTLMTFAVLPWLYETLAGIEERWKGRGFSELEQDRSARTAGLEESRPGPLAREASQPQRIAS